MPTPSNLSDADSAPGLRYTPVDRLGLLELSRPDAGNRVDLQMLARMTEILEHGSAQHDVLLIEGAGPDFCLGRERPEKSANPVSPFDAFRPVAAFYSALSRFPGLVVTAVQGRAVGFGVGIALRSDICIAAEDASFTLDEVTHGIPPMFVLAELVDHLHRKHLMDMVMTGRSVPAVEAQRIGIASRTCSAADLASAARALADQLSGVNGKLSRACKRYAREVAAVPHASRMAMAMAEQTLFTP